MHKHSLFLKYLQKQRGGRNINATFKTVCSAKGASAKLLALRSIKSPDESDDFVHVVKSQFENNELVVKVQEPGRMLTMELEIHNIIKSCNNVIKYICDFECMFDNLIWTNPIQTPRHFCDIKGEKMHVIVMEYINNDVSDFLESGNYNKTILESIVKQAGIALLEFHMVYYISHNDINRGNILLKINDLPKILTYKIHEHTVAINTYGHEVIYIDFQRGNILNDVNEYNYELLLQITKDEISLLYELMSKWAKPYKSSLTTLMEHVLNADSVKELIDHICTFNAVL